VGSNHEVALRLPPKYPQSSPLTESSKTEHLNLGLFIKSVVFPETTWANNLTVVATTIFIIMVVPIVLNTTRLTIFAFVKKPRAHQEWQQDSEFCPPSIKMAPAKPGIKNHAATAAVFCSNKFPTNPSGTHKASFPDSYQGTTSVVPFKHVKMRALAPEHHRGQRMSRGN